MLSNSLRPVERSEGKHSTKMKLLLLLVLAVWHAAAYPSKVEDINDVVNGYNCPRNSAPWQVYFTCNGGRWCGGSLINQYWVVSAAHCYQPANTLVAYLGEYDTTVAEGREQAIQISKVIKHPNYNSQNQNNDIMLVKLSRPAQYNQYVTPIALPASCAAAGTRCLTSGWGNTVTNGVVYPNVLQCLNVPIISNAECKQAYPAYYTNNMICAGFMQGGQSTCQGDSGGPLACNGFLQGVVSWGYDCAMKGHPTVYAKVCNYNAWINQIVANN
ncbi:trypsin-like [Lissotriton helveticus]